MDGLLELCEAINEVKNNVCDECLVAFKPLDDFMAGAGQGLVFGGRAAPKRKCNRRKHPVKVCSCLIATLDMKNWARVGTSFYY